MGLGPLPVPDPKQTQPPLDNGGDAEAHSVKELENLDVEAKLWELTEKSQKQKLQIQWWAVGTGVTVTVFMALFLVLILSTIMFQYPSGIKPVLGTAAIIGPIVSITTVTGALFIGAFGGTKGSDISKVADGAASTAAKVFVQT